MTTLCISQAQATAQPADRTNGWQRQCWNTSPIASQARGLAVAAPRKAHSLFYRWTPYILSLKKGCWDFPGGPVVKTRFNPWSGN